ncbi:hypothetical protein CCQ62_23495 [Salmonella enterica]|nr:hypothetical protein [Salmonella enterica]
MESDISIKKQARLRDVFFAYIVGVATFILSCLFVSFVFEKAAFLPFLIYFLIGIYLTKIYLPQIIAFHPVWNTIDNLVSVKLRAILFWPLFYFFLLIKLGFLHSMK